MKPKEQRIKDIEAQYPDEWVLIEVAREDRYGRASHGVVLGHGGDSAHDGLAGQEIAFGKDHPQAQTFLFWTGKLIPEGVGVIL